MFLLQLVSRQILEKSCEEIYELNKVINYLNNPISATLDSLLKLPTFFAYLFKKQLQ